MVEIIALKDRLKMAVAQGGDLAFWSAEEAEALLSYIVAMEQAVQFYANPTTWMDMVTPDQRVTKAALEDRGGIARAARDLATDTVLLTKILRTESPEWRETRD